MRFKDNKLKHEFYHEINPKLRAVLFELDDFIERIHGKELVITCLNRTPEENRKVGGIPHSAHLSRRAADIRSWIFSEKELDIMIQRVKDTWGDIVYIVYHEGGTGPHIHININLKYN